MRHTAWPDRHGRRADPERGRGRPDAKRAPLIATRGTATTEREIRPGRHHGRSRRRDRSQPQRRPRPHIPCASLNRVKRRPPTRTSASGAIAPDEGLPLQSGTPRSRSGCQNKITRHAPRRTISAPGPQQRRDPQPLIVGREVVQGRPRCGAAALTLRDVSAWLPVRIRSSLSQRPAPSDQVAWVAIIRAVCEAIGPPVGSPALNKVAKNGSLDAPRAGFEPATYCLGGSRSIH